MGETGDPMIFGLDAGDLEAIKLIGNTVILIGEEGMKVSEGASITPAQENSASLLGSLGTLFNPVVHLWLQNVILVVFILFLREGLDGEGIFLHDDQVDLRGPFVKVKPGVVYSSEDKEPALTAGHFQSNTATSRDGNFIGVLPPCELINDVAAFWQTVRAS